MYCSDLAADGVSMESFMLIIIFSVIGFIAYLYNNWRIAIGLESNDMASILIIVLVLISIFLSNF